MNDLLNWAYPLLRWFHFLAGITWIGILYYFNFVQAPFFGMCDKDAEKWRGVKPGMVRGLLPIALWWFRWGAMFTFLIGLFLIEVLRRRGEGLTGPGMAMVIAGALFGTLMWANVWFVIWPNQRVVIENAERTASGGQAIPDAAARGARAGLVSRTNVLLSVPMLLFMGGRGLQPIVAPDATPDTRPWVFWVITLIVLVLIEANALKAAAAPLPKPFDTPKNVLHAGLLLAVVMFVAACVTM
jgi:uncharacterized membrane protein